MRVVCRIYVDGSQKPHIDEFKTDCDNVLNLEDAKESLGEFLEEGLQKWSEIVEAEDDTTD